MINDQLVLQLVLGEKCIVWACQNHKNEGQFVGNICSPCYDFITKGAGENSQIFRNAVALILERIKWHG